jgi:hypothetical protein
MPGSPATSPIFAIPRFSNDDVADFAGELNAAIDRIEAALNALVPVGLPFAWPGATLPTFPLPAGVTAVPGTTPEFAWADGDLIDRTIYTVFFAVVGHGYNAGVDPGGTPLKVRKPDKRGRVMVGADNMGIGAAGRLTTAAGHNNARGQNGGEERHTLSTNELPQHRVWNDDGIGTALGVAGGSFYGPYSGFIGGNAAHNVAQPYEVDNVIVRIA